MEFKKYFVTGIGTGIGKTIVSAILVEALKADYWKPIQSGELDNSDTSKVRNCVSNNISVFHPERFRLSHPLSPHISARLDNVDIHLTDFLMPNIQNHMIVEGAGGLMVPINYQGDMMIDLVKLLNIEVILVVSHYLGSINHTLLSIEALKNRGIKIKGLIFNGESNQSSEEMIIAYSHIPILAKIPVIANVSAQSIKSIVSSNIVLEKFI